MRTFVVNLVEALVAIGIIITAVRLYLELNKIWSRKHERPVADSISVIEVLLAIGVGLPFFIKFVFIDQDFLPALNDFLRMGSKLILLFIGIGFWVEVSRKVGFFKLLIKALNLERRDSAHLIKSFLQPAGRQQLLEILEKVASVDNEIAKSEVKLIQDFADEWGMDRPNIQAGKVDNVTNLVDLRESVASYLEIEPPAEQVAQLVDILELMIKADQQITEEEELIFDELTGMINDYLSEDNKKHAQYEVLLVPQNVGQVDSIRTLIPTAVLAPYRGGQAFSAGRFYSKNYAEAICQKYITLGLFSTWEKS